MRAFPFGQVCHHPAAQLLIEEAQVPLDDGWVRGFLLVTQGHSPTFLLLFAQEPSQCSYVLKGHAREECLPPERRRGRKKSDVAQASGDRMRSPNCRNRCRDAQSASQDI